MMHGDNGDGGANWRVVYDCEREGFFWEHNWDEDSRRAEESFGPFATGPDAFQNAIDRFTQQYLGTFLGHYTK